MAVKAEDAAKHAQEQLGQLHGGQAGAAGPARHGGRRHRPPAAGVPADLSGVADAYPGDDAPREQIAAWMAKQAEARGLPRELPIMASLVESGMKNLHFGDADSVGFFQMRVGIWNQGDVRRAIPDKPELQVKWFLDQAESVKKPRIAAGKPIDDPNSYGDWIADVERPAEQYRGRYQLQLDEAQSLLKNVGSTRRAARRSRRALRPSRPATRPSPPARRRSSRRAARRRAAARSTRATSARRAPAARRRPRPRRCCTTRTSSSTTPASPTSRRARSTRAWCRC